MFENRIKHLEQMHRDLDKRITDMDGNHPHVDEAHLHEMKKQRLALRDEISRLNRLKWEEEHERVDFDDDR